MKKRVGSLLLALALCLSLLPTAAFAEGEGGESGESAASVVSVTIGDVTTEYSDIIEAFESVNYKNVNATFELLDDVYLPEKNNFPGRSGFRSQGTSTLDLNGHTITHADTGYKDYNTASILDVGGGTLTITGGGAIHGMYNTAAISVSSQATLIIDDGITVEGNFAYGGKEFYGAPVTDKTRAIAVKGGTLELRGGTFTASSGVALEYTKGTVRLYGGSFSGMNIATKDYSGTINEGVYVTDLLAPGYTYQHSNGTSPENFYVQSISDVTVVKGLTPVPYVDENGEAATTTNYIQIEPDTTMWNGGVYVVKGNVTVDGNVTVTGKMPSIILCDRASLTVNGSITLPGDRPEALTIYGQTGGTGTMTVTNKSGAAFSCEGLAVLRLLRGTLTATGKDTAFSNVITWNQTGGNDEIKCIATGSEPETWADGQTVPSVTLSRCTEHQWSYAQHASAEQHMRTCALCGYNPNGAGAYENCVYDTYYGEDESGHRKACLCHRTERGAALTDHTPDYIPNPDGKTHGYRCTVCDFVSDAATDKHSYVNGVCSACKYVCPHEDIGAEIGSPTEGVCKACNKRIYVARLVLNEGEYYETVEYAQTVREALERHKNGGPVVTLLCDVDMGTEALVVTGEVTGKLLDLNGHTLSGSGDTVFQIYKEYGFTVRNGTIENTGDGDAIQLIRVKAGVWGYSDGNLTLEDVDVTAAKGWAVKAAYQENDIEGEVNPSNGELYIKSGTFKGGLNGGALRTIQLSGGTFIANPDTHSIMNPGPVTGASALQKYLAPEHTYADTDGNAINYFASENHTLGDKTNSLGYRMDIWLNAETVTITEHTTHTIDPQTGKCSICGAPCPHVELNDAGFCTACGGRVMYCEVEGTLYPTIYKALEAVTNRTDDPVIKLLADYTDYVTNIGTASGCTLDLNGFRITTSQVIIYKDHVLTIIDSSENKNGSMGVLWVDGGHVTIQDGSYAELIASYADSIKVTGEGTVKIRKIRMLGDYTGSNKKVVADLLNPGYAVYLVDGNTGTQTLVNGYYNPYNNGNLQQYLPGPYKESPTVLPDGQYYTVLSHTHDFADSTVTACACGKTCDHANIGADGKCDGCGMSFTAKATDTAGNTVYYADGFYPNTENTRSGLDAALAAAVDGSTVTVLGGSSVTGYLDGGKTLTLKLDDKNVSSLYIGREEGINALNVTGSGDIGSLYVHAGNTAILTGWTGKMDLLYVYDGGKVTLTAGTVARFGGSTGTAGSVLAAGRAFQNADGSFVEYGAALSTLANVTVAACSDHVVQNGHCIYCNKTVAAMVNGTAYNDLNSAVTAWLESGGTMTLYASADNIGAMNWTGGAGKTYTLDLNGCKLTAPSDDSGSTALSYQITVTNMDLTVQDTSTNADGQIDNLLLSTDSALTLKSGWLGMLTVPKDDTVRATLEGGGLKGYDIKVPLAYVLPDGGYLINEVGQHVSLWGFGSSGNTVTVRKAPINIGGEKQGTMPFGRNLLPFAPAAVLNDGTDAPAKITAAWYRRDGSPLADAEIKLSGTGYVYDRASEEAGFESYKDMTAGGKYDLFMVLTAADESGRELWQAAVTGYELTIGLSTLDDAEIRFTNGSEAVFDPDGSTGVPVFTVTLYGNPVDSQYYTVSGDTANGVGTYTVSVTGDGTNYVGSTSAEWTVRAYKLGAMDLDATATRAYDGTTEVPDSLFTGSFRSGETAGGTAALTAGDYRITAASYNSANVGGTKTVTYTVELLNKNYVFENGAAAQTFTAAAADILKADAPTADPVTLTVVNDLDKTYAIDLPKLPVLLDGCAYGNITYSGTPEVAMTVDGYYSDGARVDKAAKLLLHILKNTVNTTGKIGEVKVTVTTANYNDITLTVNVVAANKIVPAADTVSATAITYGEALSASTITGTMKDGVQGDFAWTDSLYLYKPAAGRYEAEWKFTPTGSDAYKYAATTGKVTVEVRKATMSANVEQYLTLTYDGTPQVADVNRYVNPADKTTITVFTYATAGSGPYTEAVPAFTDAGSYTVYFLVTDPNGNHEPASGTFTVTIDPKTVTDPLIVLNGDLTYTGEAVTPAVTVKDGATVIPAGEYSVSFSSNTNAGTARVTITDVDGGNYIVSGSTTFEITRAASSVTAAPTANALTYNGTEQELVTAGAASGGEMQYSLTESGGYSAAIPTGKDAGAYTIYYKAVGDANHNDTAPQSVSVTIGRAGVDVPAADASPFTYNGADQTYFIAESELYTVSGQVQKNAGSHTVAVALKDTANYSWSDGTDTAKEYTFRIDPKPVTITVLDKRAYTGSAAPDLSAPVLGKDYAVEGLIGSDALVAGPTLAYDPAAPDMRKAGTAARIVASNADAGGNYQFTYVDGVLILVDLADPVQPTEPALNPGETVNGSITVASRYPSKGSTVTITVEPDEGYVLDDLTVTDKDGNELPLTDKGDGKYTFVMPAGKVEVKASFTKEAETSPFVDVSTDAYYYEAVKWAAEAGITGGIGGGLFGTNQPCTRAQIVTFLWRAAGSPEPRIMSSFSDVPADSYYVKAVAWAVENGITTGTGGGFSPNATCTRAQSVTFLFRAAEATADGTPAFMDVAADAYYAEAVKWAADHGITSGIGNGLFGPDNACTRAQIVTFLWKLYAGK